MDFLNIKDQNDQNLIDFLADLAMRDSLHDFGTGEVGNFINSNQPQFLEGLPPGSSITYPQVKDLEYNGFLNIIKGDLPENFLKPEMEDNELALVTQTDIPYKFKSITTGKSNARGGGGLIDAKTLIDKLNIESNSAIVIDAASISLFTILKNGEKNGNHKIYYVMTPEVINDPATKTPLDDPIFKLDAGINLIPCETANPPSFKYNYSWDNTAESPYNKFFTKYNFQISELQRVRKGKTTRYSTDLLITDSANKLIEKVNDSKTKNAINFLSSTISNLIKLLSKKSKNDRNQIFSFNAKLQQKRSGDWLQSLACLNMMNSTIPLKRYLPPGTTSNDPLDYEIEKQISKVYLVTHDIILLAFTLLMGGDAIFTHAASNKIYIFKKDDPDAYEERLNGRIEAIKREALDSGDLKKKFDELNRIQAEYSKYYEELIIKEKIGQIKTIIGNYKKFLTDPVISSNFTSDFNIFTQEIFKQALMLTYLMQLIPDIRENWSSFNTKFGEFITTGLSRDLPDLDSKKNFIKEYESLQGQMSFIQEILNKYTSKTGDKIAITVNLNDCYKAFLKTPHAKLVKGWKCENDTRIWSAFKSAFRGSDTTTTFKSDKNIFLYYLSSLPDDIKRLIFDCYKTLYDKIAGSTTDNSIRSWNTFSGYSRAFCVEVFLNLETPQVASDSDEIIKSNLGNSQLNELEIVGENNEAVKLENDKELYSTLVIEEEQEVDVIYWPTPAGQVGGGYILAPIDANKYIPNDEINMKRATYDLLNMLLLYSTPTEDVKNAIEIIERESDNQERSIVGGASPEMFHPLLPIYMISEALHQSANNDIGDYNLYLNYLNYLQKMKEVIIAEADDTNKNVIGFGLRALFFTNDVLDMFNETDSIYGISKVAYIEISLLTNSLRNLISGTCIMSKEEIDLGNKILKSRIFTEFMTSVNLQEIFKNDSTLNIDEYKINTYNFLIGTGKLIMDERPRPPLELDDIEFGLTSDEPMGDEVIRVPEETKERKPANIGRAASLSGLPIRRNLLPDYRKARTAGGKTIRNHKRKTRKNKNVKKARKTKKQRRISKKRA